MISSRLTLATLLLASTILVQGQVYPESSIDPLNGSSFSTPYFTAPVTYTITSTFPNAGVTTQTVISGSAGPSPATNSYAFTYDAPVSSLSGVYPSSLFSSLAANGQPTEYTAGFQAPTKDLQIVDAAPGSIVADIPFLALGSMTIAGIMGALWIL